MPKQENGGSSAGTFVWKYSAMLKVNNQYKPLVKGIKHQINCASLHLELLNQPKSFKG